jgi:hypothetical protein
MHRSPDGKRGVWFVGARALHEKRQTHLERSLEQITADLDAEHALTATNILLRLAELYDTL